MNSDFDSEVRLGVLRALLETSVAPSPRELAGRLGRPEGEVAEALHRLAAGRALVLGPGGSEVLMAHPLSSAPTRFRVTPAGGPPCYANCVWDALGVPAMLATPARVEATCGDCDAALTLEVDGHGGVAGEGVAHFAVPAASWWDDIVFS